MGARATISYAEWVLVGNVTNPKNPSTAIAKIYMDPLDNKWGYRFYTGEKEFGLSRREMLSRLKILIGENNYLYQAPRAFGFDPKMPYSPVPKDADEKISARVYRRELKKRTKGEFDG